MKTFVTILTVVLVSYAASAQSGAKRTVLQEAEQAMGANLRSIQYSGSGYNFAVGQSINPRAAWTRFNVKSYTRVINFENDGIIMAYLPKEKLLIEADVFTPPAANAPPPATPNTFTVNLCENLQRQAGG